MVFGAAVITSLVAAIVIMYRERGAIMREMMQINQETTKTYIDLAQSLEEINARLEEIKGTMLKRLLQK